MSQPTTGCVVKHEKWEHAEFGLLCTKHRNQLDADSREIGYLIIDTQRIIDGGAPQDAGPRGDHTSKRADPPAPADLAIMTLFDKRTKATRLPGTAVNPLGDDSEPVPAVLAVVASWMLLFAEERPLVNLPASTLAQLDLMRRHHDWASSQLWVDDYALELAELRRALKGAVHDHTHTLFGYCDMPAEDGRPKCGGALLKENGSEVIRCASCRTAWVTDQERARLAVRVS